MSYTCRAFASIDDAPLEDWLEIHYSYGDPFTDPRFFKTVERTMGHLSEYRALIFYDERDRPVAITSISTCKIDAAVLAGRNLRKVVEWIRQCWSNYLYFKIIMGGLPVTVPQKKLCIVDGADTEAILRLLDEALCDFAAEQRSRVILMGDFDMEDGEWLDAFTQRGYHRADSPPLHWLELSCASYDEYLKSMRTNYRGQVKRELASFQSPAVRLEAWGDGTMPSPAMTEDFYRLYLELLERTDFHLMTLPIEFYEEFLQQFADEIQFFRVFVDEKPAGFTIGLAWKGVYYYIGNAVDVRVNRRYQIYFNLAHKKLGAAIERGANEVILGITADDFKLRLGSRPRRQIVYIKTTGCLRLPFHLFAGMLLPTIPAMPPKNVFHNRVLEKCP